ncbi:MAG TPA: acylphosphatase [bacterium]|nr:acylphosphatase [bacterium]
MKAVSLRIRGRVQGVYYRGSAQDEAERLAISGFARNDPDGSVAAFAQGEDSAVEEFISWCRRGPSGAQVTSVDVHEESPREMKSFRVL